MSRHVVPPGWPERGPPARRAGAGSARRPPGCSTSARPTTGPTTCCAGIRSCWPGSPPTTCRPASRPPGRAWRPRGTTCATSPTPETVAAAVAAYEREGARLVAAARAVALVEEALRGGGSCAAVSVARAGRRGPASERDRRLGRLPSRRPRRGSHAWDCSSRSGDRATCAARPGPARRPRRGDPRLPDLLGLAHRRPPRPEPRRRRAHPGPAPRLRLPARPDPLGHRPPGVRAQDGHRPGRPASTGCGRRAACPATRARPSPTTTSSRTPTPRPRCPTPTASPRPTSCAARPTGTWSR